MYAVFGSCASVAGDNPLCEGLGNVDRRIIADRESSVDISLCTSYMILDYTVKRTNIRNIDLLDGHVSFGNIR